MNVLIACEESQTSCIEFRKLGHNAYSCDIQECSGGHPEWHILGDALNAIESEQVVTMDGKTHYIGKWDLLIAHPPCTYLSKAGSCRMFPRPHVLNLDRYEKAIAARDFFMRIYNACCDHICIENPVPLKIVGLPCHSQVIQPFMFGEPYSKMTYLWTKGLPRLIPTHVLSDYVSYIAVCGSSQKVRSKSFPGISKAFATQYSAAILSGVNYSLPVQLSLFDWS